MWAPQVQSRGSASKDVVSYYTSRSIGVAGFLAQSLIHGLAGCFPHIHPAIQGRGGPTSRPPWIGIVTARPSL